MEAKDKLVAVYINEKGGCEQVLKVKTISSNEYAHLLNQASKSHEIKSVEKKRLLDRLTKAEEDISKLKYKHLILAKSVFDNLVDKGKLETTDEFENMWFDYLFNDGKFDTSVSTDEFNKILGKVGNFQWEKY